MANRTSYDHVRDKKDYDGVFSVDSMKASKHAGVFAYKGRIPANHIVRILVYSEHANKWFIINDINKLKQVLRNRGDDFWQRYGDI